MRTGHETILNIPKSVYIYIYIYIYSFMTCFEHCVHNISSQQKKCMVLLTAFVEYSHAFSNKLIDLLGY